MAYSQRDTNVDCIIVQFCARTSLRLRVSVAANLPLRVASLEFSFTAEMTFSTSVLENFETRQSASFMRISRRFDNVGKFTPLGPYIAAVCLYM